MGKKKRKENSVNTPMLSEQEQDEARRRKKRDADLQAEIDRHNVRPASLNSALPVERLAPSKG